MKRERGDTTPHGYPPSLDQALPAAVPWVTSIHLLSGVWIDRQCVSCNRGGDYPLRLLAAQQGWFLTLRQLVPRLKCSGCGRPFARLALKSGTHNKSEKHEPDKSMVFLRSSSPVSA